jgi:hypothetical protein
LRLTAGITIQFQITLFKADYSEFHVQNVVLQVMGQSYNVSVDENGYADSVFVDITGDTPEGWVELFASFTYDYGTYAGLPQNYSNMAVFIGFVRLFNFFIASYFHSISLLFFYRGFYYYLFLKKSFL